MDLNQNFSSCLVYDDILKLKKTRLVCMIYAWISKNSRARNDASTGNVILNLRKLITVRTLSLQLFVRYTSLDAISIFKLVEAGIIFYSDNFGCFFSIVILHSANFCLERFLISVVFSIFQHPFIKDATDLKSLHDLICEVKAEVIVEERDADDVEVKVGIRHCRLIVIF